jgi:dTDP-4-amino-4,6-dideoxygalactose transaminase
VLTSLRADGIEVQIGTYNVAAEPAYGNPASAFPGAAVRADGDLALPFHELLRPDELELVVEGLDEAVRRASQ